jgi:hypothetical protein
LACWLSTSTAKRGCARTAGFYPRIAIEQSRAALKDCRFVEVGPAVDLLFVGIFFHMCV